MTAMQAIKNGVLHIYSCTGEAHRTIPVREFSVSYGDDSATVTFIERGKRTPEYQWLVARQPPDFDEWTCYLTYIVIESDYLVVYDSREHLDYDMDTFNAERADSDAIEANHATIREIHELYRQLGDKTSEIIHRMLSADGLNYRRMAYWDAQGLSDIADSLNKNAEFLSKHVAKKVCAHWTGE